MDISVADIEQDIEEFQERISSAQTKLAGLAAGHLSYPEHQKRKKQYRELQTNISHYENLIKYAHEGIAILQREEN